MSLENIAAGLFNFNPVQGLQAGTSMGAQMMQIALQSQQQQLDAGAKWDQAQLAGQRNDLSRRTQMFNEMTSNLNRFDEQARQQKVDSWAAGVSGGGGGYSGGGGASASYESLPSSGYAESMPQSQPQEQGAPMDTTQYLQEPAQSFSSAPPIGQGVDPNLPTPAPEISWTVNSGNQPIGGNQPASISGGEQSSFSASPSMPSYQNIVGSSKGIPSFSQGPPAQANDTPSSPVKLGMGTPQQSQAQPQGDFPTYLETDAKSKVAPSQLHGYMRQRVANSQLNGFVPRDGERFGIKTGAPEEWADYFTGLANVESGFGAKVVGDVGRFLGNSNGLYQLSPKDALNYKLRDRPFTMDELNDATFNADAAVKIHEKLVLGDGVIAEGKRGAARYWGPLRRGVTPQTQGVVAEARGQQSAPAQGSRDYPGQGQIPGMAGGGGSIDAGLFPPSSQPSPQQAYGPQQPPTASPEPQRSNAIQTGPNAPSSQTFSLPERTAQPNQPNSPATPQQAQAPQVDYSQFPEYRAAQESRAAYQETVKEQTQNAMKIQALREQSIQLSAEEVAVTERMRASGARPTQAEYNSVMFPITRRKAMIESQIAMVENQQKMVIERQKPLEKSANDAEASWKIVQDRQSTYQKLAPQTEAPIDRKAMIDAYENAESETERDKIRLDLDGDGSLMKIFDRMDERRANQGGGGDTRTWKVSGDDYNLNDIVKFYVPFNPITMDKPDGVQALVESNPKLKAEVLALQGQSGIEVNVGEKTVGPIGISGSAPAGITIEAGEPEPTSKVGTLLKRGKFETF